MADITIKKTDKHWAVYEDGAEAAQFLEVNQAFSFAYERWAELMVAQVVKEAKENQEEIDLYHLDAVDLTC
jgi:hypothetical protein